MDPATVSIMNQITCCGYSRCNGCQCSSQSGRTYTYTYIYICGVRTSVCGTHGTQMNQQAEMRRDVRSCFIFVSSCGGERCRQHEVQVGVTVNTVWSRLEIWLWSNLEIRKWRLRGPEYFFWMNTWFGSVALGSQLFQFFCTVFFLIGSWHVGSSGGHRRAVTAGHRKGPGGD